MPRELVFKDEVYAIVGAAMQVHPHYIADFMICDQIILEIKAIQNQTAE